MSSSQPFEDSSQSEIGPQTAHSPKSKFTYRHLAQLAGYTTGCPLRVIAHIDLDAFYAQCEMVRLGVAEDQPLAVQQWQGLIAINYPARKYGISRHATIVDAKKACPDLITQHVATWREGDEKWAYRDDADRNIATHKVSLDPYRLESRRILALIKEVLPAAPLQRVEKASIDEVFLDLSAHAHSILLERYHELNGPAPYDDPTEHLPRPPSSALDWKTDALVDLDGDRTEDEDPDWDDVVMLIGSEIVRSVRASIREKLKYTCSAGLAQNKMLAKLGSAHKKPNQQTIVRNRAIQQFLSGFEFTKIRNLGGKLGDQIVEAFGTSFVSILLETPIEQLKSKLGDDTGSWVYQIIRGIDTSEVNPSTQIKSMLSAKSFRPSINNFEQGARWLRIFVADIYSRLIEEGVLENKRRPKTINLHHRQGGTTKSRQAPIPQGKTIDEPILFDIAKKLFSQIILEGKAWPCANLSLSVGGFEEGPTGIRGIGAFLVKGEEAKPASPPAFRPESAENGHSGKRRKTDRVGIQKFFNKNESGAEPGHEMADRQETTTNAAEFTAQHSVNKESLPQPTGDSSPAALGIAEQEPNEESDESHTASLSSAALYQCDACGASMTHADKDEHLDWHFAQNLQKQVNSISNGVSADTSSSAGHLDATGRSGSLTTLQASRKQKQSTSAGRGNRSDKGQTRLTFGVG